MSSSGEVWSLLSLWLRPRAGTRLSCPHSECDAGQQVRKCWCPVPSWGGLGATTSKPRSPPGLGGMQTRERKYPLDLFLAGRRWNSGFRPEEPGRVAYSHSLGKTPTFLSLLPHILDASWKVPPFPREASGLHVSEMCTFSHSCSQSSTSSHRTNACGGRGTSYVPHSILHNPRSVSDDTQQYGFSTGGVHLLRAPPGLK